ncbi:MAG TPA: gamma-glutamyl-gamma-aminobutyrate hydrolase family protein [Rhodospirillales bacterium]|jgi:putative glutamine amidotransferase|nr:gamma-glutamyl-gamma-aminobutyrate hydrolase family protein [Rhodospirillales bacterium]
MTTPIIGITMDCEQSGDFSKFPCYSLRANYAAAVIRAGGLPVALAHASGLAETYLGLIDGLVVTGGDFDIDPSLFGAASRHPTVKTKDERTDFEMTISKAALERDTPVLGICGGQQLLHVALGGTLIQHIPDKIRGAIAHEQPNPRDEAGHDVTIARGTLLHDIVGVPRMAVNSAHHQAAMEAPAGVVVNAVAADGVIEGIETPGKRFCLGVQWHPEFAISDGDTRIFAAFVKAAREYRQAK